MDLRFYLSLFLRRLPWFLFVALSVAALGITVARILPTVYVASATLVVEGEQIPDSLAASTVRTDASEQLQIIQQRILSRDTLIDMANRLQIYAPQPDSQASGQPARRMDGDALVADLRKRIQIVTTSGTTDRGASQATLVTVRFEAPTADMAAAGANDVVTQILKTDVEMRTGSARQTLDFFSQEVARLDKELAENGAAMLKFKEANKAALPDGLSFNQTRQVALLGQLQALQATEAELTDRRTRMVRLHTATQAGSDAGQSDTGVATASAEQQQLRALKDQLTAQQAVLSPNNPRIKLLKSQVAALESVVSGQSASGLVDDKGKPLSAYDVQLADADAKLATLAAQKAELTGQMDALQAAIDATPGNAIALDVLQRNYDNTKAQYDLAVTNKARAETGDTIETLAKGQRIAVIEQAVAPTAPARPNRKAIAAAGILGGLVLGLALIAAIEVLQTGIRRPAEITAKLGITVFATLPYMKTLREIRLHRLRVVGGLCLGLLGIAAGLWAVNTYYMPLDLLFDQVIRRVSQTITPIWPPVLPVA